MNPVYTNNYNKNNIKDIKCNVENSSIINKIDKFNDEINILKNDNKYNTLIYRKKINLINSIQQCKDYNN